MKCRGCGFPGHYTKDCPTAKLVKPAPLEKNVAPEPTAATAPPSLVPAPAPVAPVKVCRGPHDAPVPAPAGTLGTKSTESVPNPPRPGSAVHRTGGQRWVKVGATSEQSTQDGGNLSAAPTTATPPPVPTPPSAPRPGAKVAIPAVRQTGQNHKDNIPVIPTALPASRPAQRSSDNRPACKYFASGACRFGTECRFAHIIGAPPPSLSIGQEAIPSYSNSLPPARSSGPQSKFGQQPNVHWRSVPLDDLRQHPLFFALPDPSTVLAESPRDFWRFRQDSSQWLMLRGGRLGGALLPPALGLFEPTSQRALKIPLSLAGHRKALETWHHLRSTQPPTLADLNRGYNPKAKTDSRPLMDLYAPSPELVAGPRNAKSRLWAPAAATSHFPYTYTPPRRVPRDPVSPRCQQEVRMVWGSAQESTSLLTVVNYFSRKGARVMEVGACAAEVHHCDTLGVTDPLPLLGASPDAVLCWPDGRLETVEIKNHCPFHGDGETWYMNDRGPFHTVAPWYVPQVMLEMFAVGPTCMAGYLVSCSATKGVVVIKVQRDNAYIRLMLLLLSKFCAKYVSTGLEPPADFFCGDPDYSAFLNASDRISNAAKPEVVIDHTFVQRAPNTEPFFV
jgi:hypothetical protein